MNDSEPAPTSNMVYVSLFLVSIVVLSGGLFFLQRKVTQDTAISKILTAAWFTLIALVIFLGFYWAFRGFPPGSRIVIGELPTENDLLANQATLMFFYTQWCPYSDEAMPKIKSLAEIVKGYTYGGKNVSVSFINCENDTDTCRKYGVTAYPTYKLITSSKVYEYLGPARTGTYEQFLITALGERKAVKKPS